VFSDDPSVGLHRVAVDKPRGSFVLLVPHIDGGVRVELVGHPRDPVGRIRTARTLARVGLRPLQEQS
jgi:hypothetical protein